MTFLKRAAFVGVVFLLIVFILFSVSKIVIKDFKEFFWGITYISVGEKSIRDKNDFV